MRSVLFALFIICICLPGCQRKQIRQNENVFKVNIKAFNIEDRIQTALIYHNDIICLLGNGKIVVFDSNYNHKVIIEDSLKPFKGLITDFVVYKSDLVMNLSNKGVLIIDSLYHRKRNAEIQLGKLKRFGILNYLDTTWVWTENSLYSLHDEYNLTRHDKKSFLKANPLVETKNLLVDSVYNVYGCNVGEFGGNVFFLEKRSRKYYLYPMINPSQVLKVKNSFYVFDSYRSISIYMIISDPVKLFVPQWTKESLKYMKMLNFCCNCDTVNALNQNEAEQRKMAVDRGVDVYYDTSNVLTIVSFIRGDQLYSLQSVDSFFYIVEHVGNNIHVIDSIKIPYAHDDRNSFVHISQNGGKYLSHVNGGYSSWDDSAKIGTDIVFENLVIVKNSKIDILHFYKEEKTNKSPFLDNKKG